MASDLARREAIYPGVAFAGGAAPPPTFAGATPPAGPAGRGHRADPATLEDGVFTATVAASRPGVVLLKASYDPRWTVTVDGLPDKPVDDGPEPGRRRGAGRNGTRSRSATSPTATTRSAR